MNLFILVGIALTGFGIFQETTKKKTVATPAPSAKPAHVADRPADTKPDLPASPAI